MEVKVNVWSFWIVIGWMVGWVSTRLVGVNAVWEGGLNVVGGVDVSSGFWASRVD